MLSGFWEGEKDKNMNDYNVIENMKDIMWKSHSDSREYKMAQNILKWKCERIRQEQKVVLSTPAKVGSLREKLEHEVWLDNVN